MFEVSINKKNADFEKNNILSVLTWFCKVKNYDEESYEKMLNELNIRFKRVLNSSDNDYLPKTAANKTNENEFLKLWDMILENQDEFLNYDLDSKINLLSDEDIKYFQNVKNKIQTYKKNSIKDEIILINSSMKIAKITENSKKYDFIKQILNDFCLFYEQNKLLEEKDKIEIIKRRLHLFLNKETKTSSYFEKLFSL